MNAADLPDDGTSTPEAMELRRGLGEALGTMSTLRADADRWRREAGEWAHRAGRAEAALAIEHMDRDRARPLHRWLSRIWRAVVRR